MSGRQVIEERTLKNVIGPYKRHHSRSGTTEDQSDMDSPIEIDSAAPWEDGIKNSINNMNSSVPRLRSPIRPNPKFPQQHFNVPGVDKFTNGSRQLKNLSLEPSNSAPRDSSPASDTIHNPTGSSNGSTDNNQSGFGRRIYSSTSWEGVLNVGASSLSLNPSPKQPFFLYKGDRISQGSTLHRLLHIFKVKGVVFIILISTLFISFYNMAFEHAAIVHIDANSRDINTVESSNDYSRKGSVRTNSGDVPDAPPLSKHSRDNKYELLNKETEQSAGVTTESTDDTTIELDTKHLEYLPEANFTVEKRTKIENYPRIVFVDPTTQMNDFLSAQDLISTSRPPFSSRLVKTYPSEFSDQTQLYPKYPSHDILHMQNFDRQSNSVEGHGKCVPVSRWQNTFHPTCNSFHELDMHHRVSKHFSMSLDLFGLKGFWRHAWHVHDVDALTGSYISEPTLERLWFNPSRWEQLGDKKMNRLKKNLLKLSGLESEPPGVVLKTLKYEHNFESAFFETNRIDAVAMERLTSSPHVMNIYGYCGMSAMTEYGEGDFKPLIDSATPLEKLKYARDVASGLAATHYMDGYDRNLTMVHNDLNPSNVMVNNGTVKLNDYNIGILMTWHKDEHRLCRFHNKDFANAQWRAPEEQFVDDEPADEAHTEKIDIYALGNIFFRIIAEHDPWKEYKIDGRIYPAERNQIAKLKRHDGQLPKYLDKPEIETSTDPAIVAIRSEMMKCYKHKPEDRPTAIEIESQLSKAYQCNSTFRMHTMN